MVSAYPNPFTGAVAIQLNADEKNAAALSITDVAGRVLTSKSIVLEKGRNCFPIPELHTYRQGVYIVEVTSGSEKTFLKLLKQ